uniref:Uncharacterized protein n=1 Tax=Rhizophora mucronata TaxID=61149 RepID=A0A2P2NK54_RHIMU
MLKYYLVSLSSFQQFSSSQGGRDGGPVDSRESFNCLKSCYQMPKSSQYKI